MKAFKETNIEQYINKAAVASKIERARNQEVQWMDRQGYTEYHQGLRDGYANILSFLATLEVKEVDFEKLLEDYGIDTDPFSTQVVSSNGAKIIAKHFFELGLKAQKGE
jgi:hypothetical protein